MIKQAIYFATAISNTTIELYCIVRPYPKADVTANVYNLHICVVNITHSIEGKLLIQACMT